MMKRHLWVMGATALLLLSAGAARATNGYFTAGVGIKNIGTAGAGTADPSEVMIIATNPAGLAFVRSRIEVGLALFNPDRSYSTSPSLAQGHGGAFTIGPNNLTSGHKLFEIPYIAYGRRLDAQNSVAVAFYARGGMNTTWYGGTATFAPGGPGTPVMTLPGTYGMGTAGVSLMQGFLNLSFAHVTVGRHLAVGVSLIFAAQRFQARGLGAFAGYTETFAASGGTVMPTHLTDNGHEMSYGGGAAVGVEWRPVPEWGFAASYTSKMFMSRLSAYSDLFAGHGSFDIPASADIGATFEPTRPLALSFDVQRIFYSQIASVANPIANLFGCPTAGAGGTSLQDCLGGAYGAGFGWRDMTVYKLGARWRLDSTWTVRVGVSHGGQPIPRSQMTFNILAPGVIENHITVGLTRHERGGEFDFAAMFAPNQTVSGPNTFDPTQTITVRMHQFEVDFGYAWDE